MRKLYLSIYLLLSLLFLIHYVIVGQAVYGDGIYYWSYTRSLYFDHDIAFQNELSHRYSPESNNISHNGYVADALPKTKTGLVFNQYPPGAPIAWLPFFLLADIVVLTSNFLFDFERNGYSDPYQIIVGLGNIGFILLGLSFLMRLLGRQKQKKHQYVSLLTILLATNLLYYGSIDVLNSHPFSFFISCVYLYYWYSRRKDSSYKKYFVLGALSGILATVRTQDAIFLIVPIADEVLQITKHNLRMSASLKHMLTLLVGFFVGFLPQLVVWHILYGSTLQSPYMHTGNEFNFLEPRLLELFFNRKTGILYFSPVLLFAIVGLIFRLRKKDEVGIIAFLLITLQMYLIASWNGWHQGESYGIRMLISLFPFFTIGLHTFIIFLRNYISQKVLAMLIVLFILHNCLMIMLFLTFLQNSTIDMGIITQERAFEKLWQLLPF